MSRIMKGDEKMVRTNVVALNSVPGVAYRQKLPAGGSGIVIFREDFEQPGIASISKTSGEAIPSTNTSKELYPQEAFQEAISLTAGLPYKKQGAVKLKGKEMSEEAPAEEEAIGEEVVVDSADYQKIVDQYTDKNGRLSYSLLNKDMIQFAHRSSRVRKMLSDGANEEAIRLYITGTKFRNITEDPELTDAQVLVITELLDEVSPKGVFKELNSEIRKELKAAK